MLIELRKKVETDGVESLTKSIVGFGQIFTSSYESRWSNYKTSVNTTRKTAFMGRPQYKMICLRQWTPHNQLPTGMLNCGHAAYVDEFVLHMLDIDKSPLFVSEPGSGSIAKCFDLSAKRMAKNAQLQSEMTLILFNALKTADCVGDNVSFGFT